ncbi:bifunctional ADP-dependent NAD(P)H-hydrate dehydratase/NAD(P)H-hydrate epimerase [Thermococcus thioreducens]|uniref:Bifunctional NAD(P)H-hydrate repair enzyme n=1 Tax=Thermococcus thioreducens TaxID=277988 RepID=A0A0Q2MUL2_9EURY|nr:bifunctional ADP-dependent NAD(P)H-hydrate dehydratase/NAD(P)H-hydrate epimerase [Thermococcus thioreducens]ASJ11395.1 bifunctional ADP-dependent (S)-NAD(P)H-hydrate dehydratase/NAD(P)H-hydrate epimerase [Thermococcus thioreducens]KQH83415.1 carbohydrate kinase [Thermococcus thioreducens]SEW07429.1 NAD(P)H-hydrate epimerase [Thermococcus thioreducens]
MRIEDVYIWDINAEWLGITPYQLMENAGASVARVIEERFGTGLRVAVFSGTGNNGGDGFVAARHLSFENDVALFLVGDETKIRSEEARHNWEILKGLDFVKIKVLRDSAYIKALDLSGFDVIVDALLGAGTRGEPREPIRSAIEKINEYAGRARIVSVDLPSGYPSSVRVNADFAVTFQWDKEEYEGFERVVVKIGYPKELYHLVGPGGAKFALRKKGEHKGQNGKLLIIGGSSSYYGAPYLASKGASYLVDLVYLAMPSEPAKRISDPDLILRPVEGKNFSPGHVHELLSIAEKADAVVIGPGIGLAEETNEFVREFVKRCEKPLVIDADGLKAVAEDLGVLKGKTFVLTPHGSEFKVLFGVKPEGSFQEKAELVRAKAREIGGVILLKGAYDIISDGKTWKYNRTGNRGMTTGGTGDVLAGLVGALLALGNEPLRAASVGAFLNGLAGDMVKEELGENFTALEVAKKVPHAVRWVMEF